MPPKKKTKTKGKAAAAAASSSSSSAAAAPTHHAAGVRGLIPQGSIEWQQGWDIISNNAIKKLQDILDKGLQDRKLTSLFDNKQFVLIYTMTYSMCTQRVPQNHSDKLYAKHSEVIASYLTKTVLPALRAQPGGDALLRELKKRWEDHDIMNTWLMRFFMYLDRYHVKHMGLKPLLTSGVEIFQEKVYDEIKGDVSAALLALIAREREGEAIDQGLIAAGVSCLDNMGKDAYRDDFEAPLLEATKSYYALTAQAWLATDDTPAYLLKAQSALDAEVARVRAYLHGNTEKALLPVVVEELLGKHVHTLVDREGSGCAALLAQDKFEDLNRMYCLMKRVGVAWGEEDDHDAGAGHRGLTPVAAAFKAHVEMLGCQVIDATSGAGKAKEKEEAKPSGPAQPAGEEKGKDKKAGGGGGEKDGGKGGGVSASSSATAMEAAGATYIRSLLDIHEKHATILQQHLGGYTLFSKALKDAFGQLVNKAVMDGQRTSAELLAAFVNKLLAKGGEKLNDAEIEAYMDKVLALFSYLHDKDVYLDAYSATLAKRLLSDKSSSADWEKAYISKLKAKMGPSFVSRLEGMLSDLNISKETMVAWAQKELVKDSVALRGFSARVLTQGIWPSTVGRGPGGDATDVLLPQQMAQALDAFKRWYVHRNPGRRLAANHLLGQVEIRATFYPTGGSSGAGAGKSYDAACAPLQAVVLLAFDGLKQDETLSLAALAERTRLPAVVLKPIIHSLACAKYKLLAKTPPGSKSIGDGDLFSTNKAFACPKRVFALQLPDVTRAHNPQRLEEDRGFVIDAAIVRVAKARRLISHNELLAEVAQQINLFKAQPPQIKKRIAGLIEKEYLERSEADRSVYRYMP